MKYIIFSLFLSLSAFPIFAQSSRSPTAAEKAAIDKAVQAVMPVLQSFADNNWVLKEGGADDPEYYSVQRHPDVVMGAAPFTDMKFSVKQGSPLWNTEIKPILEKIKDPKNAPTNEAIEAVYNKWIDEYGSKSEVIVEVHVNEKNLEVKPIKGSERDLKIPGCYFSYKPSKDPITNQELTNQYVLVFGNWKTEKLKYYSDIPFYEFSFVHPKGSPYIENIVIILKGNHKRIEEMLHKINWNPINKGLTL